jgi:hypothetical protein
MPTNRIIYFGVLIIAASALLWLGAWLAMRIAWILPYTGIAGILMVIIGLFVEAKNKKEPAALEHPAPATPSETASAQSSTSEQV